MSTKFKLTTVFAGIVLSAIGCSNPSNKESSEEGGDESAEAVFDYPQDVMAIIDNKCMGCHNPDSKSDKAKEDLIWEDLPTMDKRDLEHTLGEIQEVLEEGKMPPEKMLKKHPEKALTEEEVKVLTQWTNDLLVSLE